MSGIAVKTPYIVKREKPKAKRQKAKAFQRERKMFELLQILKDA